VKPALVAACVAACAHGDLRNVPLLVSSDVMADSLAQFKQAQVLRSGLMLELRRQRYCLDRAGDFEGMLQLRADTANGDLTVFLTLDDAAGARIEEVEHTWRATPLPAEPPRAADLMHVLLRELAGSNGTREFASEGTARCLR